MSTGESAINHILSRESETGRERERGGGSEREREKEGLRGAMKPPEGWRWQVQNEIISLTSILPLQSLFKVYGQ